MRALFLLLFVSVPGVAQTNILFVGDSHAVGCFGQELDVLFRGRGIVRSVASCGSSSASWLAPLGPSTTCGLRTCSSESKCQTVKGGRADSLWKLLQQGPMPPSLTVVELGSNMLANKISTVQAQAQQLIGQVVASGSQCVWIGPPQAATKATSISAYKNFVQQLKATVVASGCHFVDSDAKTSRLEITEAMGLHYNCAAGRKWADQVFTEMLADHDLVF